MSENANDTSIDFDAMFSNPDLRSLPIGGDEFNAVLAKASGTDEEVDVPADIESSEEEQDEPDEEVTEEPKKKSGFTKRIDKLVSEKRALERRLAELESAQVTEPHYSSEDQYEVDQSSGFDKAKPKSSDFNSIEEFTDALTDWKLDKREFEREAQQNISKYQTAWEAKEAKVKETYADYHDIVNLQSLQHSNASQEARVFLADSDIGPEVIYNLLSNEDLFDEFVDANPVKQVKILTKVELSLEKTEKPVQKTTSAPNPPKKLNASRPVSTGRDLIQHAGEMSDAEWLRLADEHSRNKRKR